MKFYCDGFTIGPGNPSPQGGGYVVTDQDSKVLDMKTFPGPFTNNDAEIRGVLKALELANTGDTVVTDSKCALAWAATGRSKARPDLAQICKRCLELIVDKSLLITWVSREKNLAGKVIESYQNLSELKN